jgi:hypothetical protein
MACLKQEIDAKINETAYTEHCIMTVKDVVEAVSRIKSGKHDGYLDLSSDHVKHACHELFIRLSMLFTALIIHGSITDDFINEYGSPYPEGKKFKLFGFLQLSRYSS